MSRADVVVIGSGVAGLTTAIGLARHPASAPRPSVLLITAGPLGSGSTGWAQGGIAAAIDEGDSPAMHAADTMTAAAGHADSSAVTTLATAAPAAVSWLADLGARFDRAADGSLSLTREGGHGRNRVVHAGGDATGAEVCRTLVAAALDLQREGALTILSNATVNDLAVEPQPTNPDATRICGVRYVMGNQVCEVDCATVVLATGGAGGLWPISTNPAEVTGAGIGLALKAGATCTDLEFVQFHPTALIADGTRRQVPLITEALRGEGGVLIDLDGNSVMHGVHSLGDLAPRDIVTRRIVEVLRENGESHVLLDATGIGAKFPDRFPTVFAATMAAGIDPRSQAIPVAPAQHFLCGGVEVDGWGRADVAGLYAVGEVAATGVHGANRLASNSLLEGLVFGARAVRCIIGAGRHETPWPLRRSATRIRGLSMAADFSALPAPTEATTVNSRLAAAAIMAAQGARRESRGTHWRIDHPDQDPAWAGVTIRIRLDSAGELVLERRHDRARTQRRVG